jgi:S-DNA-T family DNA segregation ATPase FtsK/SpoIIIE
LSFVVNRPGSIIIASAMLLVGLVTVWVYDWQRALVAWRERAVERVEEAKEEKAVKEKEKAESDKQEKLRFEEEKAKAEADREAKIREQLEANEAARAEQKPKKQNVTTDLPSSRRENMKVTDSPRSTANKKKGKRKFVLPSLKLMSKPPATGSMIDPREIGDKAKALQETLDSFSIDAIVGEHTFGPRVTLFEIKPAAGVKVERISSLSNNIAMVLKAESLRILAPIPGKDTVGIEVPNSTAAPVYLRDLLEHPKWAKSKGSIPIALGKDIAGDPVVLDLARAPHLLIAGATGSGKSVCMNTLILSLLYKFSPDELKMIMVDPKVVELSGYNTLPHLVTPVITEPPKAQMALNWAVNEMERRYRVLAKVGVRNLEGFNSRTVKPDEVDDNGDPIPERLPYLVVIVDELADLMMASRESKGIVETSLARIAQKARAVGIHAVIATQRPDVKVITGTIKANFPTRIAFQVTSVVDSRTILDAKGAESLLGRGDMLYNPPGSSRLERTQGAFVPDKEIDSVVEFVSDQVEQEFVPDMFRAEPTGGDAPDPVAEMEDKDEELVQRAIQVILQDRRATTSHVQRRLRIGYNRAATVIETLEQRGMIGPQIGTAPREILITEADLASSAEDTGETPENDLADED